MLRFLKANAMQVAGACQLVIRVVLAFVKVSGPQALTIATIPTGVGTILAGIIITNRNGQP